MRHSLRPLLLLLAAQAIASIAQVPIGQWRDHFPYRQTYAVTEGNGKAWCATPTAVFSYDPATGEYERLTKVNRLNDVGIRCIRWNHTLGMLVVGYDNGNLDLVSPGSTYNLSDIKRSNILGDKGINHLRFEGDTAYLSCGFGIVVVDLSAREVRETWLIGPAGVQLHVNGTDVVGDSVYAATESGLYSAYRNSPNLAAFTNWHKRMDIPMPNGEYTDVVSFGGKLMANYHGLIQYTDTVFYFDGGWQRLGSGMFGNSNLSLDVSLAGDRLVVTHDFHMQVFDNTLVEVAANYGYGSQTAYPAMAIRSVNGYLWIADRESGLVRSTGNDQGEFFHPNGPARTSAIGLSISESTLFVATGSVATNWSNGYRKDGVHHFADGDWRTTSLENEPLMVGPNSYGGAVNDIMAVAVDPDDKAHAFAGSWDDGILEFRDRQLVGFYNQDNTNGALQIFDGLGSANVVQVAGIAFDKDGNMWVSNSNVSNPVVVRKANGTWKSFNPGTILNNFTLLSRIVPATNGYKWFIRPRGNGLLVFNDGGTIDNTSDDQYKVLNTFEGTGKLPSSDVYSMAEDLDNEIWVGTGKGVAVFYNPDAIFSGGDYDAQQILIEQDGNVQILLETEVVTALAVDGGNRKWLGTITSGAYLVSPDGTQQIQHFTEENSPLPSNNINDIAIDEITGEVYFATDRGIMSYRSDATDGNGEADCATVFPNPVRGSHTGPVAITGLVRDSDVKITDMSGNLVYRTTSLGGQAMWPGTDMSGNRVSGGVYLAYSTNSDGTQKCMTKILVMR
ncbi:MAG: hypothetical protein WAU70_01475 [Flavobacteriales bacterium]